MSRRTRGFRAMKGKTVGETAANILARNSRKAVSTGKRQRWVEGKPAKGVATGAVGTLPMSSDKVQRLAASLHRER